MTADYNGWQDGPEDEREGAWEESDDPALEFTLDDHDAWRGDAHPSQGDGVLPPNWPHEEEAGPEYWLQKGMEDAERDRRKKTQDEEGES